MGWSIRLTILTVLSLIAMLSSAQARTLSEIIRSGELRLCVAGSNYKLYSATGRTFARYLGVNPRITHLSSWDQQFQDHHGVTHKPLAYTPALLADGLCDLYPNDLVMVPWRLNKMVITPLYATRMTVVVPQATVQGIHTLNDLAGKTAALMKGTIYHTWLEKQNNTRFIENPVVLKFLSTNEAIAALSRGDVDFSLLGADGAFKQTQKHKMAISVAFPVGPMREVGWATHMEHHQLRSKISTFFTLQHMTSSPFDHLWEQYVGIPLTSFNLFITSTAGGR
ncbi:transporter substrate-binding domain-containing protein [Magnetococcus sp. PR-3]|uniref:transporter substrate-binding domain-containing protein n=1 Tax=Magnetococcus sp. PR-3 TaxID=3120355 RepID=UPI002FCE1A2F